MTATAVNQRVRTGPANGGGVVVLGVWCPTCREEVGPMRDGTCPICDQVVYDEDRLTARDAIAALDTPRPGGQMTSTMQALVCKVDGCGNDVEDRAGLYAKLCTDHKTEAKQARAAAPKAAKPHRATAVTGDLVVQVKQLLLSAKALERARSRIEQLPSNGEAKASFDEAARRASNSPTPENLKRVTDAAKILQKGSPRRTALEVQLAEAELAFSRAFDAIELQTT